MINIKEAVDSVFENAICSLKFTIASLLLQEHSNLGIRKDFPKSHALRLNLAFFIAKMQWEDRFTSEQKKRFAGYLLQTTDEKGKPSLNALELLVDFYEPASHLLALNPELEISKVFPQHYTSRLHLAFFIAKMQGEHRFTSEQKKRFAGYLLQTTDEKGKPSLNALELLVYEGHYDSAPHLLALNPELKISEAFPKKYMSRLCLAFFIAKMQGEHRFTSEQKKRFAGYLLQTTDEKGKPSLNALELLVDKGYNEAATHLLALNPAVEITDNFPREAGSLNHLWRFILDDDRRLKKERSKILSWQIESGGKPYNAFNQFLIQGERDRLIMLKTLYHAPDSVLQANHASDERMILGYLDWVIRRLLSREKNHSEAIMEFYQSLKSSQRTSTYLESEQRRGLILAIKQDKTIRPLIKIQDRIKNHSNETQAQKNWWRDVRMDGACVLIWCFILTSFGDLVSILGGAAENSILRDDYIFYFGDGSHSFYNTPYFHIFNKIPASKPPWYSIHSFKDFFQGANLCLSIPILLMLVLIISTISFNLYIEYKLKKLDQINKSEIEQARLDKDPLEKAFVKQVKEIIVTPLYKARQRLALAFLGCQDKDQPPQRVTNDIFQLISKQLILNHQVYSPVPPDKINCFDADLTKKISAQFALKAPSISP